MRLPASIASAGLLALALVAPLTGVLTEAAAAEPAWPTYHRDSVRSGADPDATEPIEPAFAWESPGLGAPIWSQPLILGSRAYVATVGDKIIALDAATGAVVWQKSVGVPVPAGELPCGDVLPTVGIVGTPVIDISRNVIYAVADTWDAGKKEAHHALVGLDLSSGAEVLSTPVDPPGADPKAILQRTALNLDGGRVVFGFGGNDGDCSEYVGAVGAAPEDGGAPLSWQVPVSLPSISGGAIWAPSGPAVGPEGNIYATTGNPVPPPGQEPGPYDYSDSVVQLDPALGVIGSFAPPNWKEEGEDDLDLSSAAAELLPGGLLFQAGKDGQGYLIEQAAMSSHAPAVDSHQVCGGHGSFGGDAYAAGIIYIPCTNGVQALAYDQSACTFTPLWQGPSDAFGPPIVSAGLVWVAATGGFSGGGTKLYGIDPATGQPRYTETLPSPIADHFASPSAAGGRLLISTGSTVTAYQIAKVSSGSGSGSWLEGAVGAPAANCKRASPPATVASGAGDTSLPRPAVAPPPALLLHTRLKADNRGRVRITLRCAATTGTCKGTLTMKAKLAQIRRVGNKRVRRTIYVTLGRVGYKHAKGTFTVTVRLGPHGRALLKSHRGRLALQIVLTAPPAKTRKVAATLLAAR
jgi:polyvinyl alcohol dehydrogenase (cytochrome)